MRTSTQERWYSPHWTKVALGSAKINLPATKRTRIYKKPGVYFSGPVLGAPWRYAAVAELAIAPSAPLASVLDIDFSCLSGAAVNFSVTANAQFRRQAITLLRAKQRKGSRLTRWPRSDTGAPAASSR